MTRASYGLDKFRRYVLDSSFLNVFDIDEEEIEKFKDDEISLMKFGFKYLKYLFMMEESLKVKSEILEAKKGKE